MFTHLHGHSHYSLLEAIGKPAMIAKKASDYEMEAIALTDYNGLYGAIEFYTACQKNKIKPLLGVELGYVYSHQKKDKNEECGNIVLLASSFAGYNNILKLTSVANLDGRNAKARVDNELLKQYSQDIIVLMGGHKSRVSSSILNNEESDFIAERINGIKDIFGSERCFMEVIVQDESKHPEIKKINNAVQKLASQCEIQLVCANNFHYVESYDQKVSEVALAIKDGKRMFDDERRKVDYALHIMTEKEIKDILIDNGYETSLIEVMFENIAQITNSIDIKIPLGEILFPKYESPQHIQDLFSKNKDNLVEAPVS